MDIGQRIKEVAKEKGFKQKDLARLKNVTEQAVSHDLKQKSLGIDNVKEYANILGVDYNYLIKEKTSENQSFISPQRYLAILEENNFLKTVLLKNGIRVEFPNFKFVSNYATV